MRDSRATARLVLLVTAVVFINYIDRGNLATAAPLMQDQLHLSASQLGILLSVYGVPLFLLPKGTVGNAEDYRAGSR